MKSALTNYFRVDMAKRIRATWSATTSNTYIGIGHIVQWSNGDVIILDTDTSVDGLNGVFENLIAIKKVTDSDMSLVVPRKDWAINTKYDQYDQAIDMFSEETVTPRSGVVSVSSINNTVTGNGTSFSTNFVAGQMMSYYNYSNGITEKREVVSVQNNISMTVNTSFAHTATSNTYDTVVPTAPNYANKFYIRNSADQVFLCVDNNYGTLSTEMPEISIGGNLPQNPYVVTADGYKWKYLYTIPSGLKIKFFTTDWMPVTTDTTVQNSALDGRIDLIRVLNGGTGYNANVPSSNATILSVAGNGSRANAVAEVSANGTITSVSILSGGSGYTYADVRALTGLTGNGAILEAVIQPHGGFGFDPAYDLGATNLMVSVDIAGDEGGDIPVTSGVSAEVVDYHQISVIQDPRLSANVANIASGAVYNTTTGISTGPLPAGSEYAVDDIAFQGVSLDAATFVGNVVNWDPINNKVYLNNIRGTFTPFTSLRATLLGANITAFAQFPPVIKVYTGNVLYVQNRTSVSRAANQTEQIKLIIEL